MSNSIRKIFSEVPRTYELVNHILTLGMDISWRRKAAREAASDGGSMWLDMCSGTGEMAANLRRIAPPDTKVFAADGCLPMLKKAVEKPEAKRIYFTISDAGNMAFHDSTFDLITISFAGRNLNLNRESFVRFLREFLRILRPGGRLVVVETSQPPNRLIRFFFHLFVGLFVKPLGGLISGSRAGYTYLANTIPRFYTAEQFAEILTEAGFSRVTFQRLMFGAAAIHKAIK